MIQGRVLADESHAGTFAVAGTSYQAQCDNNVRQFYTSTYDNTLMCLHRQLLHISITMKKLQLLYYGLHHLLELVL